MPVRLSPAFSTPGIATPLMLSAGFALRNVSAIAIESLYRHSPFFGIFLVNSSAKNLSRSIFSRFLAAGGSGSPRLWRHQTFDQRSELIFTNAVSEYPRLASIIGFVTRHIASARRTPWIGVSSWIAAVLPTLP